MKLLSLDCTAGPASVAIVEEGKVVSTAYANVGLTHSQTLVPMVESALRCANLTLPEIDRFAINAGPGSVTGVRIGAAALKGLTLDRGEVSVPVSTLESMAYNYAGVKDTVVCAAMDARCQQVYTALFEVKGQTVHRLCDDCAITITELGERIKERGRPAVLVGDGAELTHRTLAFPDELLTLAPQQLRYQNAVGTALCAEQKCREGFAPIDSATLLPVYLRAPQAERELKKRQQDHN